MLDHNPIGDRGLLALASGCLKGQGVALTELGLEACSLGCLCAKPLTAILQDWTSLRQLTLSWNNLGLRGEQAGRMNECWRCSAHSVLSQHACFLYLAACMSSHICMCCIPIIFLPARLPACLSVRPCIRPSVRPSVCLSACLSVCLSACAYIYPAHLFVCLATCLLNGVRAMCIKCTNSSQGGSAQLRIAKSVLEQEHCST